ncbi:unconventional myosin-Ic-A-like isoform X2 [Halichondria panicea]|uniref:unconventional myosin-Ic-A-like isoform X2 n=1 Tax=Halichondria panicea TaxID=6063 RepID=UPI00312B3717
MASSRLVPRSPDSSVNSESVSVLAETSSPVSMIDREGEPLALLSKQIADKNQVQPSAGGIRERSYLAVGTTTPAGSASTRLEITPLLSGERDWQAAVLRVVPVREECHAATRMTTLNTATCQSPEPRAKGVVSSLGMDIEFDFRARGAPVGGHIKNDLLEKSRVVYHAEGEGNFHQLLASRDQKLLSELELSSNPKEYHFLSQVANELLPCLCPATWPEWEGPPKQGVESLCQHLGYTSDQYKTGRTKLFIRFPDKTEDLYQQEKHDLATIISAKWKMYVNRKKYQQLRWASTVFATNWKRLQVQRYVAKYKKAVFVVRKFIIGFMNRSKPKCEENIYFLDFVRVNYLMKLSRSLPSSLVAYDEKWPGTRSQAMMEADQHLKAMYRLHRTGKFMRKLTKEDRTQYTLKLAASDLFRGKKETYPASVARPYLNTHLSREDMCLKETHFDVKVPSPGKLKFSQRVVKYDRHGYKARTRAVIITDRNCFFLDTSNFKVKEQFPLSDISTISVSSLSDGVVVIGLPTEGPNARGDLIIKTEQVIELVTKLALFGGKWDTGVKVVSTGTIVHHMPKHKTGTITFQKGCHWNAKYLQGL